MKPPLLSLIGARLQRPALALPRLVRPALRDALDRILAHRLSCVTAPAGFGKSQALTAWAVDAEAGGVAVYWLRLAADECQGPLFAAYLEAALDRSARAEARRASRVLIAAAGVPEDTREQLAALLARLAAEAEGGTRQVLILDDAQALLGAPQATALLLALLREAPADFHLVLLGRVPVLPPPADLQAQQQVLEVGPDVLRGRAARLVAVPGSAGGTGLTAEVLDWCDAQTDGWPLALQLMLRHLQPGDDLAAARARWPAILADLEAFLAQDVLVLLPPPLLASLQLLALTERIDLASAEVLTAAEDAHDILQQLSRHGLLRPDPAYAGHWLLERLIACCLRERLQRERPGHAALLYRRLAEWSAGQGRWPAAIPLALAGGDAALAAQAIEQAAEAALADGAFTQVLQWIESLPEDSRLARPRLLSAQAWALTFLHRRREAAAVLERLAALRLEAEREALAVSAVMQAMADDSADALYLGKQVLALAPRPGSLADHAAHTAVVFGLGAASHFDQVDALRQAQPQSGELDTAAALYRQTLFAFSAFQAGRLDAAGLLFEEVLARSREAGLQHSQSAAMAAAYLAAIHYERDDPELARRLLQGRRQAVADGVSPGALLHCLITEARLALQDGAADTAFTVLQDGVLLGRRRSHLRLQAGCLGESIRLMLALGRPVDADRLLRQLLSLGIQPPADRAGIGSETWDLLRMAEARVLLACNAPRRAVPLLRSLCDDLEGGGREYLATRAAVVLVRALEAAGDPEGALPPLARALRYGQRNGLVRTFADEGTALAGPMARLLLEGALPANHEVDPEYLRRLRAAVQPSPPTASAGPGAAGPGEGSATAPSDAPAASVRLTARETDILQYMARGLSNKQIARALGLSPETVKWYLKHIYDKLQVSGRVQAIQAGLGIRMAVGPEPESEAG